MISLAVSVLVFSTLGNTIYN